MDMVHDQNTIRWSPWPGHLPETLDREFSAYSLQRDIEQTNLIFYAFAVFAVINLGIDLASGVTDTVPLNSFFLFLSLAGASFMRRVMDHRLLQVVINVVSVLIVAALIAAKMQVQPDDWFVYFADIFIIASLTLTIPVNFFAKLLYALLIVAIDIVVIQDAGFGTNLAAGIILMLLGITAFSAIIYYKMQQAHFATFLSLRKEKTMNDELRNARSTIGELQQLLPVCASCKKVRDDNGYWEQIDEYIRVHMDVGVTHSVCPDCMTQLQADG